MEEELRPDRRQPNQIGQEGARTSEHFGVGQNVTEENLDMLTIGAIPTGTHDYVAPSPDLDFSTDGDGNDGNTILLLSEVFVVAG